MNYLNTHCVLKLNKNWQPFFIDIGLNALIDLFKGTVRAVHIDYDKDGNPVNFEPLDFNKWSKLPVSNNHFAVKTVRGKIRIPSVVVCENYNKIPVKKKKLNKQTLFERDRGICQYTGKKLTYRTATIDHVMPRSKGGIHAWENVVLAHHEVNHQKGSLTLEEAGLRLLKKPLEPRPVPTPFLIKNERKIKDWNYFLLSNSSVTLE
jgi:5-methylcytosine-specific restriction endonuclease McrA